MIQIVSRGLGVDVHDIDLFDRHRIGAFYQILVLSGPAENGVIRIDGKATRLVSRVI
jgi:hypothetical protein